MATASNKRSTNQKEELTSLLECSICLEPFDNPRTLHCFHSFCKNCLENFVKDKHHDDLNCPVCRAQFTLNEGGVAGMTKNHFLCNMVEVMSIQDQGKCIPCTYCQKPSAGRCVTCELFMCEKCFKAHNDYPGFQDHDVLTMEELSKPENQSKIKNSSKCSQHPKKKLKYYCETCDELICRHCMDFDHDKQHKFTPLEKAAKTKRENLRTHCETLERIVNKRNKETQQLTVVQQSLNSNFNKAQHIINNEKEKLLDRLQGKLEKKTNSMIKQVRQVYDRKTELVNTRICEGEAFVKGVKASSDMAHSLLQNANDEEIVRSCQSVRGNVENALDENGDLYADGDDVMSWSADGIHLRLVAEIKDIVQDEGSLHASRADLGQATPVHRKLDFVAFVYEDDYRKIQELVQQYPNIDTGGDLFGLWKDESTVVIQLFIGPGKNCKRTTTSFHQDVDYLQRVGSLITTEGGLCNVGEWHSHHQIGMPEPSAADQRTVFSNMPNLGLERFVLFIATIENGGRSQTKIKKRPHDVQREQVVLRSFLFVGPTKKVLRGDMKKIPGSNPHRIHNSAMKEIENGAELPPSKGPPPRSARSSISDEDSDTSSAQAQQAKSSSDTKRPWNKAQEKPNDRKTLKDQAEAPKAIAENVSVKANHQTEEKRPRPDARREVKPSSGSRAVPREQKHRDEESLQRGKKPQDDQRFERQMEDRSTSKNRDKRSPNQPQATRGLNNENVSPNFSSVPLTNRSTQSNASFPGLFPADQGSLFSNPQQSYAAQQRDRGPSSPPASTLYYHSAVTGPSAGHQTRKDSQREMQEMPPYTLASSQRKWFPNDPQLVPPSRTTAGGPADTTSYFKQQLGVVVGKMSAKGYFGGEGAGGNIITE